MSGDPGVTMDELRAVVRHVAESAERVLEIFERAYPDDPRPRHALAAAWTFVHGAPRSRLQRVASLDAHRAARAATDEAASLAARAAGDAASAAYLHPSEDVARWTSAAAKSAQVGHILRAAACVARISELRAGGDPAAGDREIAGAARRATPTLIAVVRRYPPAPPGNSRVARLMKALDDALRGAS